MRTHAESVGHIPLRSSRTDGPAELTLLSLHSWTISIEEIKDTMWIPSPPSCDPKPVRVHHSYIWYTAELRLITSI